MRVGRASLMLGISLVVALTVPLGGVTSAATKKAAAGPPLKIMLIGSISGLGIDFSQQETGAKAAVEAINKKGVNGSQIELTICNDNFSVADAQACARKAVSGGFVAAGFGFSVGTGWVDILNDANIPVIGAFPNGTNFPTTPDILNLPNSFPISGGFPITTSATGAIAADHGWKTVNLLSTESTTAFQGKLLVESGMNAIKGKGKGQRKVNKQVQIPVVTADVAPYTAQMLDGNPNAVITLTAPGNAAKVMQGVRQSGSKAAMIASTSTLSDANIKALGAAAEGALFPTTFLNDTVKGNKAVAKYVKEVNAVDSAKPKDDLMGNAYSAVYTFAQVAATLKTVTAATLLAALPNAKSSEIGAGISAPIDFQTTYGGQPRLFNPFVVYGSVKEGQRILDTEEWIPALTS